MIFNSKIHGKLQYEENDVFTFKKGILGFDEIKKFIIVDLKGYEPFKILQSLEDEEIGLILTSPFDFYENYEIELTKEIIDRLNIENEKDVLLLATVTLNSDPKKITTNLKAPLIINSSNNLGEQTIIDSLKYNIKHPLIKE